MDRNRTPGPRGSGPDRAAVTKLLAALVHRGLPHGTEAGPLGLARAVGQGKADLVDGYGWRRSHEAVASGRESSNP